MIGGHSSDELASSVRSALEGLRFDERELDDVAFFDLVSARVGKAVHAEKAALGILEGGALHMRGRFGLSSEVAGSIVVPVSRTGAGLADRIVFKDAVYARTLRDDPELEAYQDAITLLGVRNVAAIGWRAGASVLGILVAFDSKKPGGFDSDDVLVLHVAADFSAFIYRERIVRRRGEVMLRLTDDLSRLTDIASMAAATAEAAKQLLPGLECSIVEAPRARPGSLRMLVAAPGAASIIAPETDAAGTGAATVITSGEMLETDDLAAVSVHGATLSAAGFRRVLCLPITAGRRLPDGRTALGAITFLSLSQQPFSDEDRALMLDIARRLGLASHRAELLEQQAEASAGLQMALETAIDIGSSLQSHEVITRLLRRAAEALNADRATLSSIQGDDLVIEGSYAADGSAFETGSRFHYATSSQFVKLLRTRQPLHETYRIEEVEEAAQQAMRGFNHAITVPIVEGDSVVATVTVSRRFDVAFGPTDARLLELVTAAAGIALQNARLFQETARGRASLQVALEAAEDVAAALDFDELIEKLLRRACDAAGATDAVLGRLEGGEVVIEHTTHDSGVGMRWPMPVAVLETLRSGRPAHLEDLRSVAPTPEHAAVVPGDSALSVPLMLEGELVGVIGLGRRESPFAEEEVDSVRRLAPMAALLMRNARLLEDARQASRAKSDFLNLAGHELGTPLTVVRGYLSLIATGAYGDPPPEWVPVLTLLENKSRDLAAMVDSILVAARLQSGRLQLGSEKVDVRRAVEEAVDRANAAAALNGGAVVGRYPQEPLLVRGDHMQLDVILDNLLANAIKYSAPPAAVTVSAARRGGAVEIRVADRGRGIAPGDWNRIFEQFVRIQDSNRENPPGTGLGLFIARQLAETYGGSLEVEASTPGVGSTFVLKLPLS